MHMAASVRETRAVYNSQVKYCIQISNLQTQHILLSQSYSCVAKRNSTVIVIITLKTVLMKK